jgi:two-component system C4-dicarboxylate transport response regulator DctD
MSSLVSTERQVRNKILVVDDDPTTLRALRGILESRFEGLVVCTVSSAKDALDLVTHDDISVVLSDIRMPGTDGFDLLNHLHAVRPTLPVLLMSGHALDPVTQHALIEGVSGHAFGFLPKPIDRHQLAVWVRLALETATTR